ncbi:MAG TPA: hypothetical protein PKW33_02360 [Anaerolineaceae bacterium]|nr:hypothetical protein [Anaerolineaceae bacterium]HPN50403.1 hypothetical protein [Anaerolineaceae bacterium]
MTTAPANSRGKKDPKQPPQSTLDYEILLGIAFLLMGLTSLLNDSLPYSYLDAAAWEGFGFGMIAHGATPWSRLPLWRKAVAIVMAVLGITAFIARTVLSLPA